jgi:hypothetical protein
MITGGGKIRWAAPSALTPPLYQAAKKFAVPIEIPNRRTSAAANHRHRPNISGSQRGGRSALNPRLPNVLKAKVEAVVEGAALVRDKRYARGLAGNGIR